MLTTQIKYNIYIYNSKYLLDGLYSLIFKEGRKRNWGIIKESDLQFIIKIKLWLRFKQTKIITKTLNNKFYIGVLKK